MKNSKNFWPYEKKNEDKEKEVLEDGLIDFIGGLQKLVQNHLRKVTLRSVHRRKGQIFRGQSLFRGNVWRDWALFHWAGEGDLPMKIWGFVDLEDLPTNISVQYGGIIVKKGIYAVVENGIWVEDENQRDMSEIFVPILKEVGESRNNLAISMKFYLADVEAIVRPIAVIPDIEGPSNAYFYVKDRETWRKDFVEFLEKDMDINEEISDDETNN
jgi:hypothetical protein